jgi:hypothetical protein
MVRMARRVEAAGVETDEITGNRTGWVRVWHDYDLDSGCLKLQNLGRIAPEYPHSDLP